MNALQMIITLLMGMVLAWLILSGILVLCVAIVSQVYLWIKHPKLASKWARREQSYKVRKFGFDEKYKIKKPW